MDVIHVAVVFEGDVDAIVERAGVEGHVDNDVGVGIERTLFDLWKRVLVSV